MYCFFSPCNLKDGGGAVREQKFVSLLGSVIYWWKGRICFARVPISLYLEVWQNLVSLMYP